MKKIFLFAIILILTVNLLAVESVAIISASKGKVDLRRAAKVIKHKTGDFLQNNDEIRTGGESFAAYKYIDGSATVKAVSYTHLRAHETPEHLVCRLLLEKKKKKHTQIIGILIHK